jgi:hypothetical protein
MRAPENVITTQNDRRIVYDVKTAKQEIFDGMYFIGNFGSNNLCGTDGTEWLTHRF